MGRAAGDGTHYTWVLRNLSTGKYDRSSTISLPSSTSIISRVLAKPQLVPWTYRETRDAISGLVSVLFQEEVPGDQEWTDKAVALIDMVSDPDQFEAYMKDNRLRPEDTVKDAQERGKAAHSMLERLAQVAIENDDSAADALAQRMLEKATTNPFDRATSAWWVDRQPSVIASEVVLKSLRHRFAGSVDLIWRDDEGFVVCTDLKSRREGLTSYDSDHIQVGSYSIAHEEETGQTIDRETVLVIRSDGTWDEYESDKDNRSIFLDLVSIYEKLQPRRR